MKMFLRMMVVMSVLTLAGQAVAQQVVYEARHWKVELTNIEVMVPDLEGSVYQAPSDYAIIIDGHTETVNTDAWSEIRAGLVSGGVVSTMHSPDIPIAGLMGTININDVGNMVVIGLDLSKGLGGVKYLLQATMYPFALEQDGSLWTTGFAGFVQQPQWSPEVTFIYSAQIRLSSI